MIDVTGASQVLNIVSDNRLYTQRMDELRKADAAVNAKLAEAKSLQDKYVLAQKMIEQATAMVADSQKKAAAVGNRELAVANREAALSKLESDAQQNAQQRTKELAARERLLASKEADAKAQQAKLDKWENDFNARKDALDARETRIREAVKSIAGG